MTECGALGQHRPGPWGADKPLQPPHCRAEHLQGAADAAALLTESKGARAGGFEGLVE